MSETRILGCMSNKFHPLTLHIKAFMPRFIISNSINTWKSQAVWCSKNLHEFSSQQINQIMTYKITFLNKKEKNSNKITYTVIFLVDLHVNF